MITVSCVLLLQLSGAAKEFVPSSAASHSSPPLPQQPAAETPAQMLHKPPARIVGPPHTHSTVFDKAMERLATMFPDYTR